MNKFMQRSMSLFLSTLLILTSVPIMISFQEPIIVRAMSKNNMVLGTQDYMDLSEFNKDAGDSVNPNFQMLRFSLITTGEISDASRGGISMDVPNNPISIANPNGGLEAYNDGQWFGKNKVRQLVNYARYSPEAGTYLTGSKHVLNTRRDYTGQSPDVIFYNANSTTVPNDPANPEAGSHEEISGFDAYFVPIYYSEAMPQVIAGGTARSSIQDNPPAGHENWSTMEPNEFFYEYTQTSFIPTGDDVNISITSPVPDCIYRILAYMLGLDSPYSSQSNFDSVSEAYNNLVASGKCEILVEPLQCFENTGGGGVIDTFFNSSVRYVALSSAEVGMLDDCASGINYGYTNQRSLNTDNPGKNNYNFFTSPDSKLASACKNLYNSLLLKNTAWECALWALSDGIDNGSLTGAGNRFAADLHTSDNFLTGVSTGDFGKALGGEAADIGKFKNDTNDGISGSPGPYWNSIFYYQVYEDIYGHGDYDPSEATAPELMKLI